MGVERFKVPKVTKNGLYLKKGKEAMYMSVTND